MTGSISYHQTTETLVTNEDVGAEPEHEVVNTKVTSSGNGPCQIVRRCCIVEDIGWTTTPVRGVLSEWLVAPDTSGIEPGKQLPVRISTGVPRI